MEILIALAIVVGVAGVVLPVLPGILLVAAAVGIWAAAHGVWWLVAAVVVLTAAALALKIAIPARTARDAASTMALAVGAVTALIGFFAVPVIGAPVGFVAGVLVAELVRLRSLPTAWQATWATTKSLGLAMVVELTATLLMAGLWVVSLVVA